MFLWEGTMCECKATDEAVEAAEAEHEGRRVSDRPYEVSGPRYLAERDERAHCMICTGCGEIRQIH